MSPPRGAARVIADADVAPEAWDDDRRGRVSFRTLVEMANDAGGGLVQGVAAIEPGRFEGAHSHDLSESIRVLSGGGTAVLDGASHAIAAGHTVLVPAGCVHRWEAGRDGLSFLYSFPAARFADVAYRFEGDA